MSTYRVSSVHGNNSDGTTWDTAYTTLQGAISGKGVGDIFLVDHHHVENATAAHVTLTFPGTSTQPNIVVCVDTGDYSNENPTTLSTGGLIDVASGYYNISLAGYAYIYGLTFQTVTNNAACDINFNPGIPGGIRCYNCVFNPSGGNTGTTISVGSSGSSADDSYVEWRDCTAKFSNASQSIYIAGGRFFWVGGSVDETGTAPNTLLTTLTQDGGVVHINGVDLSFVTGTLVDVDVASPAATEITFANCKLAATPTYTNIDNCTVVGCPNIFFENCGNGDPSTEGLILRHYKYQGSIISSESIYCDSGADHGLTGGHSWIMTSRNIDGDPFCFPLISPPIVKWNETTGSAITATVEIANTTGTAIDEGECWLEVEYMGTSGSHLSSFANDNGSSTVLAKSTTDQTSSAAAWTGIAETAQKLSVSFTPQEKGPVICRVYLAKDNYVLYVDPRVTLS